MTDDEPRVPTRSSGAAWTVEEDRRLYEAVCALTAHFPGRSVAAVVTRIALVSPRWSQRAPRKASTP